MNIIKKLFILTKNYRLYQNTQNTKNTPIKTVLARLKTANLDQAEAGTYSQRKAKST